MIHSIFLALSLLCSPSIYGTIAWHHHSNHSCHGCAEARDELAKIRLEIIKREILEKLGLDAPPQVRPQDGFPTIPQVAKYLKYQLRYDPAITPMHTSFLADELMIPERKAERTIVLAERTSSARFNLNSNQVLAHFKFSDELMSKLLLSAVLNIYLRKPAKLHPDSRIAAVQVLVKEAVKNSSVLYFFFFSILSLSFYFSLEKAKNVRLFCNNTSICFSFPFLPFSNLAIFFFTLITFSTFSCW